MITLLFMVNIPFYFQDAADIVGIDPVILYSMCYVESKHDAKARNINDGKSPSYGLCQVKLATAKSVGFEGTVQDLYNPQINALVAALYLKHQLDRYHDYTKAISAYNAGHYTRTNTNYVLKVYSTYRSVHEHFATK